MRFLLNGCDISFVAEAPENMTVKQLVEQADSVVRQRMFSKLAEIMGVGYGEIYEQWMRAA